MIDTGTGCYDGVRTRVLSVGGEGLPIVLLHGYADSADTWRGVLGQLDAAGRYAMAVDLPGFGWADRRRPGPLLPQFDTFVDALLDDLGPAVLVGNSLGAATAIRAAARKPDAVQAVLALNDPLNARHLPARLARHRRLPVQVWHTAAMLPIPDGVLRWAAGKAVRHVLYGPGAAADPAVIARWRRTIGGPAALASLGRYAFQYAHETAAGHGDLQIACPAVVAHGAKDRIIPVQASRTLHQQIPGSSLVVLPRSGHCPQLDNPREVVRLILGLQ
ncbi:pimeloyl-ACP methyl ester carboxylesterase [Mycolicibacterium sp. BK556]|uniref:alpha/beta fold hydrolase n=1 Tax=unclassified Mycolicibacterium TaxID=2636767 RepID=UPI001618FE26|nr:MULTISPECIES: alpha/beta fold hydrolase [unclassified Mycolicibacterium]MBB3604996.1 pimeloyl-ACP methyl ester carboxylesterase [Mycolicibacterium sp. BK556]MBB3635192.1 pimeloyl-ACP methyl ester carboxylesterase [Mycolicibacterium sp. BK607]